jgi:oxygen-independent coproporphyrinogen-3 oxidase
LISVPIGKIYNANDYDELARMFLPHGEYALVFEQTDAFEGAAAKLARTREMYALLAEKTGRQLPWGVLTGVKPAKLFASLAEAEDGCADAARAKRVLREKYLVSAEKAALLERVFLRQRDVLSPAAEKTVCVYIGIPFCPTRCAYCTFPATVGNERDMMRYLEALYQELDFSGAQMRAHGIRAEAVYIGGGTPTALRASMLEDLLARVSEQIPGLQTAVGIPAAAETRAGAEFCVEAGRPDTISYLKALVIAREGATRISVNPQSLRDQTLSAIGRSHLASDFQEAFDNVRAAGIGIVNSDVIAGLPGETEDDFAQTLDAVIARGPENITVHTLSVKRGSKVREQDPGYSYSGKGVAAKMLRIADERMTATGMGPYYLYRQKQTVDNLENIGYATFGTECAYNMRAMQERQTVCALGAGAVSKLYFPEGNRIERVFNVADVGLYCGRIAEMIERKRTMFEEI